MRDGTTLTIDPGPSAEPEAAIGRYRFLAAAALDAAIKLSRISAAGMGGAVDVRPARGVVALVESGACSGGGGPPSISRRETPGAARRARRQRDAGTRRRIAARRAR